MTLVATVYVWDNPRVKGAEKLLLLAMAESCSDEGEIYIERDSLESLTGCTWPEIAQLITALTDKGELVVLGNNSYILPYLYFESLKERQTPVKSRSEKNKWRERGYMYLIQSLEVES